MSSFRSAPAAASALLALAFTASLGAGLARAQAGAPQAKAPAATATEFTTTYHNPLPLRLADGELAQNCADPAVLRDPRAKVPTWYLYCTSDPVSKREHGKDGGWHFRMIPIYRSTDLVHWNFVADAFNDRPAGLASPTSGLWAPEPEYLNGRYYLYFTVVDVTDEHSPVKGCEHDSAIGVATADNPAGPWTAQAQPVLGPRQAGPGCDFHWTFDPKVIADGSRKYLYYGSYGGGVWVQPLSSDGFHAESGARRVGANGRYEGAEVVKHDDWWYLFASATDCCNGPLTGYAVYVGRSRSPMGPFLDREGNDMGNGRAGGTPVLLQNGNRWVGTGHNTVFQDGAGQWWTIYHAVETGEPFFSAKDKLTRRLAMLDRIDWVDGWPVAADAPSDTTMDAPLTQAGMRAGAHPRARDVLAWKSVPSWSDDFKGPAFDARWSWLRPRAKGAFGLGADGLVLPTEDGDLYVDRNDASVLQAALPAGDVRIEAELKLDAPLGCCSKPVQAGFVVMRDDDNYVKLIEVAKSGLRQVEFAKELSPVDAGYPRYGNTVVGTPGQTTWLRMDVHRTGGDERYTAYSSQDGRTWVGGGTWTHRLGPDARLGLVAMGGAGQRATFVRVSVQSLSR
jgi:arabinan endo-1,5-alpha-L-arabinosidase